MEQAERLQFIIEAVDRTEQAMHAARAALDSLRRHVRGVDDDLKRMGGSSRSVFALLGQAFQGLLGVARTVLTAVAGFFGGLIRAAGDLARTVAGALVGAFERFLGIAARVGGVVGGALTAAFALTAKAGVEFGLTFRIAEAAITRMTGSGAVATKFLGDLKSFSQIASLEFKELIPLSQQLLAAYGPQGIGRVIPTLEAFLSTHLALGASTDQVKNALLGFRQLLGRDHAQQEELNQVSENLPGLDVRGILPRTFGTADTEALKAANVTGQQVGLALVAGMQQAFGGTMQQQAGSLPVLLSNFADAFQAIAARLTQNFLPTIERALGGTLQLFQRLAGNEKVIAALQVPFDLVARAVETASARLPAFVGWLEQVVTKENVVNLLANVAGWIRTIWQEVTRFMGAATGGDGLAGVWESFQQAAHTAIDFVLRAWGGFTAALQYAVEHSGELWQALKAGIDFVRGSFEVFVGAVVVFFGMTLGVKIAGAIAELAKLGGALKGLGLGLGGARAGGAAVAGAGGTLAGVARGLGIAGVTIGAGIEIGGVLGGVRDHEDFARQVQTRSDLSAAEKSALIRASALEGVKSHFSTSAIHSVAGWFGGGIPELSAQEKNVLAGLEQRLASGGRSLPAGAPQPSAGSQFAGLPGGLQAAGRAALGMLGDAGGQAMLDRLPAGVRGYASGIWEAARQGAQRDGLDALLHRQQGNAADARAAIDRFLGGGGAPGGVAPAAVSPASALENLRLRGLVGPGANPPLPPVGRMAELAQEAARLMDVKGLKAATESWKTQFEAGAASGKDVVRAMEDLNAALLRQAMGAHKNAEESENAWAAYYAGVKDLGAQLKLMADDARKAQDRFLGFLKSRGSIIEQLADLVPKGQRGGFVDQLLRPALTERRNVLAGLALQEGDPARRQDLLGELLSLAQHAGGLGGKDAFGGRFGGRGASGLDFFLGRDPEQARALFTLAASGGQFVPRMPLPGGAAGALVAPALPLVNFTVVVPPGSGSFTNQQITQIITAVQQELARQYELAHGRSASARY